MHLIVKKTGSLEGTVKAPASKSYTIRAVLSALLAEGTSTIKDPLFSLDTKAAMNVCTKLGGVIKNREFEEITVDGTAGRIKNPGCTLDTLNSGTTIRIATAIASLSKEQITLTGDDSIRRRPIQPLADALSQIGVKVKTTNGNPPVEVKGPLQGGVCNIRGDISSQFISGLLMASPYALKDTTVNITTELKSKPYVDLTLNMLKLFKVRVENRKYSSFFVPPQQVYEAAEYTVEGDYSSAAFVLAAAALTESKVTVENLFKDSLQADKKIVEIIKEMGAKVSAQRDHVTVRGSGYLTGVRVDLSDSPDLVPIVSVLGACAEGETVIYNTEHARLKECDRIKAMYTELSKLKVNVTERPDGLVIQGGALHGATIDSWNDHRIVMSLAIAGLKAEGETKIMDGEVAAVTFPNFVHAMQGIGAGIDSR
ncbi:MAG: 3-phosphoshikimate 1-carboxyvinyltransferase [Candidatus Altiarchaeota archaeon]|nr:3-phosphoshikimate 1-carboxyvinyltransferase [Candidatus Altiarchaeota archaeon]